MKTMFVAVFIMLSTLTLSGCGTVSVKEEKQLLASGYAEIAAARAGERNKSYLKDGKGAFVFLNGFGGEAESGLINIKSIDGNYAAPFQTFVKPGFHTLEFEDYTRRTIDKFTLDVQVDAGCLYMITREHRLSDCIVQVGKDRWIARWGNQAIFKPLDSLDRKDGDYLLNSVLGGSELWWVQGNLANIKTTRSRRNAAMKYLNMDEEKFSKITAEQFITVILKKEPQLKNWVEVANFFSEVTDE